MYPASCTHGRMSIENYTSDRVRNLLAVWFERDDIITDKCMRPTPNSIWQYPGIPFSFKDFILHCGVFFVIPNAPTGWLVGIAPCIPLWSLGLPPFRSLTLCCPRVFQGFKQTLWVPYSTAQRYTFIAYEPGHRCTILSPGAPSNGPWCRKNERGGEYFSMQAITSAASDSNYSLVTWSMTLSQRWRKMRLSRIMVPTTWESPTSLRHTGRTCCIRIWWSWDLRPRSFPSRIRLYKLET
jgi:hypothetical protein